MEGGGRGTSHASPVAASSGWEADGVQGAVTATLEVRLRPSPMVLARADLATRGKGQEAQAGRTRSEGQAEVSQELPDDR